MTDKPVSALEDWNDPHGCQDVSTAQDVIDELTGACRLMLKATGGSKHWNGETEKALKAIEFALGEKQQ